MSKFIWNYVLVIPTFVSSFLIISLVGNAAEVPTTSPARNQLQNSLSKTKDNVTTIAQEPLSNVELEKTPEANQQTAEIPVTQLTNSNNQDLTGQVTSVSQLSDVNPSDWAFGALQSLVERYGVIAGYPDGTFKGNRALTRYEFAAGLNAALDRLNELIATNTADLVRKEDLATLQKLREQFAGELATLRGRVDTLETRTARVEAQQFSTTTKLVGDAIFVVGDTFGDGLRPTVGNRANNTPANDTKDNTNTFFGYRARLNLQTSFTGRDQLSTLLTAGNNIPNLSASTGTNMIRFTFDSDGTVGTFISQLTYRFPLGANTTVWIGPRALQPAIFTPTLNGAIGGLNGGLSRFSTFNPTIYRPGFDGAGLAFAYKFNNQFQLNAGYIAPDTLQAANPATGGLFGGSYLALAQLTISPSRQLDIGLTYTRKYYTANSGLNLTGGTGSRNAFRPFDNNATNAFSADNFGVQFNWRASRKLVLGGWFGYTEAHQESGAKNDATIINGALTLALPDFGKKGNVAGFVIGVPPKATSNTIANRKDPDTSLHLETFYTYRVNDNITVTPTFYVITSPEHNSANDAIWVGAVRTSFSF
ncbi:iron uptake porin [Nostoc sp. MS1]|uniref:iron uptake porin n=1 Tax=Nostoc sp. MS1 TaxID=2764711 RepID=UPI001CC5A2C6|nr:iron uptake porin [Nostoc sp. MS1]BCL35996.1 porin [Nostoc sp. MS1]